MGDVITLRSTPIDLSSDVGQSFCVDCVRAAEGLISDRDLQAKYELSARLPGACGRWRCPLINRLIKCVGRGRGLRKQITLRHAVTALHLVLNPDANGVAKIVRIARQIVDLVMDYHFVGLANGLRIGDGNSDVPNLLSTPIREQKVCLTFNLRF